MRTHFLLLAPVLLLPACTKATANKTAATPGVANAAPHLSTLPPLDANNIVSIATGSKDHTTLVAALQAANYVTSVANPGPLTVFAPTNAAFDKLPKGTVEGLLQPDQQADLREVLKYHVAPGVYLQKDLKSGQQLGMANGKKTAVQVTGDKITINGANVIASIRASNGIVHVVDAVLLPPAK